MNVLTLYKKSEMLCTENRQENGQLISMQITRQQEGQNAKTFALVIAWGKMAVMSDTVAGERHRRKTYVEKFLDIVKLFG